MDSPGNVPKTPTARCAVEKTPPMVKDVVLSISGEPFAFTDRDKRYKEGAEYLIAFSGAVRCHPNPIFGRILVDGLGTRADSYVVNEQHNSVIFQALFSTTKDEARRVVQRFADTHDGVAAYMALARMIKQMDNKGRLGALKAQVYSLKVPSPGRGDPTPVMDEFVDLHRQISDIVDTATPLQLADLLNMLPVEYMNVKMVIEAITDCTLDTAVGLLRSHYESYYAGRERHPSVAAVETTSLEAQVAAIVASVANMTALAGGGQQHRGGGGGNGGDRPRKPRGAAKTMSCWNCAGPHTARDCPNVDTEAAAAKQAARAGRPAAASVGVADHNVGAITPVVDSRRPLAQPPLFNSGFNLGAVTVNQHALAGVASVVGTGVSVPATARRVLAPPPALYGHFARAISIVVVADDERAPASPPSLVSASSADSVSSGGTALVDGIDERMPAPGQRRRHVEDTHQDLSGFEGFYDSAYEETSPPP
jgi:hypothetical protein